MSIPSLGRRKCRRETRSPQWLMVHSSTCIPPKEHQTYPKVQGAIPLHGWGSKSKPMLRWSDPSHSSWSKSNISKRRRSSSVHHWDFTETLTPCHLLIWLTWLLFHDLSCIYSRICITNMWTCVAFSSLRSLDFNNFQYNIHHTLQ